MQCDARGRVFVNWAAAGDGCPFDRTNKQVNKPKPPHMLYAKILRSFRGGIICLAARLRGLGIECMLRASIESLGSFTNIMSDNYGDLIGIIKRVLVKQVHVKAM